MADYKQTRAPLDPAATPTNPVRLLSLDGGGVKGISPLLILDAIMREIRDKENALSKNPDPSERLPVDYFNLAAGTSTGGLIALMLFRLRMSTTEVMNTYDSLAKEVFSPTMFGFELHRLGRPGYWAGNVVLVIKTLFQKSQFSDKPLLQAIDKVVYDYPLEKEDRDLKGKARLVHKKAGKFIMCATLADKGECILFRSYKAPEDAKPISSKALAATKTHKGDLINQIDIATASRATSAAPTYLPEVVWKDMTFWDGGMLNNNPIDQLWAARYDLVGSTDPPPAVSCVLSLGTSWSSKKPNSWVRLVNTLNEASSFLTNTEAKHRDFERHIQRLKYRQEPDSKTEYFRFNTPTGDEEFSLDDYTKMEALKKLTLVYLEDELVKPKISTCADILIAGR